ncbi:unnamed protein product [Oppiella nova]|uniref:Uncharacterized protein n=1 Tax=Oppiella nova TaxID=334625 RepID=A0A7R9QPZ7_9ACAR|nr:unnamed protein product [Oppiella nova]CAG2171210.1 unnamed protein product [Oppiella nova]
MVPTSGQTYEAKVYTKDSLDRFGDDFCGVILSYLSFEGRFRYECVSKQWQRLVYKSQRELIIRDMSRGLVVSKKTGNQLSYVLSGNKNETLRFEYSSEVAKDFVVFVDNYKDIMKSIDVTIDGTCNAKSVDILMTGLSQMRALIDLKIKCENNSSHDLIGHHLSQIGINCPKIKSLSLHADKDWDKSFEMLMKTVNENFKQLKRLEINKYLFKDIKPNNSVKHPLRVCHHNRHHHSTGSLSVTTIDTIHSTGSLSVTTIVSVLVKQVVNGLQSIVS